MKSPAERKRRPRRLRQEEQTLWKTAVRSVAPLKPKKRSVAEPAPEESEKNEPRVALGPSVLPAAPKPARKPAPALAPFDRRLRQRLARGSEPIERRIDLHGMTQDRAHSALMRFLRAAQAEGARTVLVVTGKGVRGDGDPFAERGVLKRVVPQWLRLPEFRAVVMGFDLAHGGHGGEGALYVRLRKAK